MDLMMYMYYGSYDVYVRLVLQKWLACSFSGMLYQCCQAGRTPLHLALMPDVASYALCKMLMDCLSSHPLMDQDKVWEFEDANGIPLHKYGRRCDHEVLREKAERARLKTLFSDLEASVRKKVSLARMQKQHCRSASVNQYLTKSLKSLDGVSDRDLQGLDIARDRAQFLATAIKHGRLDVIQWYAAFVTDHMGCLAYALSVEPRYSSSFKECCFIDPSLCFDIEGMHKSKVVGN
jgi:hypothetical protein